MLRDPINRTAAGAQRHLAAVNTNLYAPGNNNNNNRSAAAGSIRGPTLNTQSSAAASLNHSLSRLQEVRHRIEDYVVWTQRAWDDLVGAEEDTFCGCNFVEFASEITGAAGMGALQEQIESLIVLENGIIGILEELMLKCELTFSTASSVSQLQPHRSNLDDRSRSPLSSASAFSSGGPDDLGNSTSSIRDSKVRELRLLLSRERRQELVVLAAKLVANIRKSSQWRREDLEELAPLFESLYTAQEQHFRLLTSLEETLGNCWS